MKKFDTVLFDLDGTLTDSAPGIIESVGYALDTMGVEHNDDKILYKFIGPPLIWSFKEYFGMSDEEAERGLGLYRERYNAEPDGSKYNALVYEGVEEALIKLKAHGVKLGVATAKPENTAIEVVKHFGLDKYFDCISGNHPDEKHSGKKDIILRALELLGVSDAAGVLMIGDREYDIVGAHEAGVAAMGVLYGFGTREEFEAVGADFIAATARDIPDMIL